MCSHESIQAKLLTFSTQVLAFEGVFVNNRDLQNATLNSQVALNHQASVRLVQPAPALKVDAVRAVDRVARPIDPNLVSRPSVPIVAKPIQRVPTLEPILTRPEQTRWINPKLGRYVAEIREPIGGVTRDRVTVPISPSIEVTDTILFEDAKDATKQFYLPRYRLAERNQQIQMSLEANGQSWNLVIHLEKYPAAALPIQVRDAKEIDHTVSVILEHRLIAGDAKGGQKEWVFPSITPEPAGVLAVLPILTRDERDLLVQVLTEASYGANLIVRRSMNVAIPVASSSDSATPVNPPAKQACYPNLPAPQLQITGTENYEAGGKQWTRYLLSVANWSAFPNDLFEAAPDLPPCGLNRNASRTWIDIYAEGGSYLYGFCALSSAQNLKDLWFAVARDQAPPASVYITLKDRRCNITYTSNRASTIPVKKPTNPVPLFREVTRVVDDNPRTPFVFPIALYDYVFRNITGTPGKTFKPVLHQVDGHSYYQDPVQKYLFYYLPNCFKLVRRPESPHYPMVSVRFKPIENSDTVQATIEYWAYPYVSATRLEAAATALNKPHITGTLPTGINGIIFQPLVASKPRLFLGLPNTEGALTNQERSDVLVELRTGFRDARTLSLEDFQIIYDALFSGDSQLFQGQVQVDLEETTEVIPFIARMNDMVGEYFDYTQEVDPASNTIRVTLKNAIESPIQVNRLEAKLMQDGATVLCTIGGFSAKLPVVLKPEETLVFTVVPTVAVALTRSPNLAFDLSGIQVLAELGSVFNSILRGQTTAVYKRPITIKTDKAVFGDRIRVISVDLKHGDAVDFSRDDAQFAAQQTVLAPIRDLVLRQEDTGTYEYRVTLILNDGRKVEDPPNIWRTAISEQLWITHSELPAIAP